MNLQPKNNSQFREKLNSFLANEKLLQSDSKEPLTSYLDKLHSGLQTFSECQSPENSKFCISQHVIELMKSKFDALPPDNEPMSLQDISDSQKLISFFASIVIIPHFDTDLSRFFQKSYDGKASDVIIEYRNERVPLSMEKEIFVILNTFMNTEYFVILFKPIFNEVLAFLLNCRYGSFKALIPATETSTALGKLREKFPENEFLKGLITLLNAQCNWMWKVAGTLLSRKLLEDHGLEAFLSLSGPHPGQEFLQNMASIVSKPPKTSPQGDYWNSLFKQLADILSLPHELLSLDKKSVWIFVELLLTCEDVDIDVCDKFVVNFFRPLLSNDDNVPLSQIDLLLALVQLCPSLREDVLRNSALSSRVLILFHVLGSREKTHPSWTPVKEITIDIFDHHKSDVSSFLSELWSNTEICFWTMDVEVGENVVTFVRKTTSDHGIITKACTFCGLLFGDVFCKNVSASMCVMTTLISWVGDFQNKVDCEDISADIEGLLFGALESFTDFLGNLDDSVLNDCLLCNDPLLGKSLIRLAQTMCERSLIEARKEKDESEATFHWFSPTAQVIGLLLEFAKLSSTQQKATNTADVIAWSQLLEELTPTLLALCYEVKVDPALYDACQSLLTSIATLGRRSGDSSGKFSVDQSEFAEAQAMLHAPELPVQVHGLILLRHLVHSRDSCAMSHTPYILDVCLVSLSHDDSYAHLAACQTLVVLCLARLDAVLPRLIEEFVSTSRVTSRQSHDPVSCRIGEVLVRVTRELYDLAPAWRDRLVPPCLFMLTNDAPVHSQSVKLSALSVLAHLCEHLRFSLAPYAQEIVTCVEGHLLSVSTSTQLRCACLHLITCVLRRLERFEVTRCLGIPALTRLRRAVKSVESRVIGDAPLLLHCRLANDEIDRISREMLTPDTRQGNVKKIYVLDAPPQAGSDELGF